MNSKIRTLFGLGMLLVSQISYATQAGGCACSFPNHVAYEFADEKEGSARLYIVDILNPSKRTSVQIAEGQISGMECSPGSVKLVSTSSQLYSFEIKERVPPKLIITTKGDLAKLRADGYRCLGEEIHDSGKHAFPLQSTDTSHKYGLQIVKSEKAGRGNVLHHNSFRLVKEDAQSKVLSTNLLFEITELETID